MVAMHSRAWVPSSASVPPCAAGWVQGILLQPLALLSEIIPVMTAEESSSSSYEHGSDEPFGRWHRGRGVTVRSLARDGRASLADARCPQRGHAGLPASRLCARPVAEEEIRILPAVQEEFLPRLVPASLSPTFPQCGKPSRKLTHCLLPPRLGAGPCCLQHRRAAPFMDEGIAHRPDRRGTLVSVPSAAGPAGGLGARRVAGIAAEHVGSAAAPGSGQEAASRRGGEVMGWRGVPRLCPGQWGPCQPRLTALCSSHC